MAKKYVLVEFPYPSGLGLHIGHAFSYTAADVYARYLRLKGDEVLFPMGWDAFGLPTENFAIKTGIKPQEATAKNTANYRRQMNDLGYSFDWDKEVNTTDPSYYRWTQWIFVKLFEKGLAKKEEMPINWCPKCKIGLANEEVVDSGCERCGTGVERRVINQWVVEITKYADRLISGLDRTQFIEKVKAAQVNWIGKKEGRRIKFSIFNSKFSIADVEVFTTRVDTLSGVEFLVLAPEHSLVQEMRDEAVLNYLKEVKKKSEMERTDLAKEKTGVLTGLVAVNPLTKKEVPVYVADYVLGSVGTGAVMGVPSHDERDREFAKAMGIVFDENYQPDSSIEIGEKTITYHLRDWIFSRQHYWGEPIPMVQCEKDGWVGVPLEQLPVELPKVEKYEPTDTGESPLAKITDWVKTTCPKCGGEAMRETDTMPNWAGSDWYFIRYTDPKNSKKMADMKLMEKWLPVDVYIGGDEHNTLHLLYSRFIYQFLWDLGMVPEGISEPYVRRVSHGVILGPDGHRMSKSRGNIITPDVMVEKYGADVLRMYLMFMGPFEATMVWNERTMMGVARFLKRYEQMVMAQMVLKAKKTDQDALIAINKLIWKVGGDFGNFKNNTAIAKMMETLNEVEKCEIAVSELKKLTILIAPVAPFLAQRLWKVLGEEGSVHSQSWPEVDGKSLNARLASIVVQVNGKLRETLFVERGDSDDEERVKSQALSSEKVAKWVKDGVKKTVFVKGRLINFVT